MDGHIRFGAYNPPTHLSYSEDSDDCNEDSGLKEEIYQEKLSALKRQLAQLNDGSHPEYRKKIKRAENAFKERLRMNDVRQDLEVELAEREHFLEKKAAEREFEEKKSELKENLLMEFEEKKRVIEQERYSLDLNGDSLEVFIRLLNKLEAEENYKAVSTRKLRRRGVEPTPPTGGKGKKTITPPLHYLLDVHDIEEDLLNINSNCKLKTVQGTTPKQKGSSSPAQNAVDNHSNEPRIENGKLYFDKKWFHKGQPVMLECKDGNRFNAVLVCAENNIVIVRKSDSGRLKIPLAQLAHGKYLVRRRNNNSNP